MAAAFLTHLAGEKVEVRSAGSEPAKSINSAVVEAMAEIGIDISREIPKLLLAKAVQESDVVITMGNFLQYKHYFNPAVTLVMFILKKVSPNVFVYYIFCANIWSNFGIIFC